MIRTIIKDDRVLFGPLQDNQLSMINQAPEFEGHGLHAQAASGQVSVYVTLPLESDRVRKVQTWFLRNHHILA